MTDDSRSESREGSGPRDRGGQRSGGYGGQGSGRGDQPRSGFSRGGGGERGGYQGRPAQGGRPRDGERSDRRDDRPNSQGGERRGWSDRRDDRSAPRNDDRRDDRGGYRRDDRSSAPRGDDRGGYRRDDRSSAPRGGDRRDDRYAPRDDDRRGRPERNDDRGGYRRDDRSSAPRGDDRGGYRRDDRSSAPRGGDRRDDRSSSRDGQGRREWSDRRDDRSSAPRGGERRDDRRGGPANARGGGGDRRPFRPNDRPVRSYRDRTEERDPRDIPPPLPEDVTANQLDSEVRAELSTLPRSLADAVARHLVMAGELIDDEPDRAYAHAVYARRKASRVGAVREAAGIAAYKAGMWQEALSDLRAARRLTGRNAYLAVMADCERGLGRPERALEIAHGSDVAALDIEERVEVRIVASGARRDLGETSAALVELQGPELKERRARPYVARLFYVYADVLEELGRTTDAREYFARASAVDQEGITDADDRLAALEGVEIVDVGEDVVWSDAEDQDDFSGDRGPDEDRAQATEAPRSAAEPVTAVPVDADADSDELDDLDGDDDSVEDADAGTDIADSGTADEARDDADAEDADPDDVRSLAADEPAPAADPGTAPAEESAAEPRRGDAG